MDLPLNQPPDDPRAQARRDVRRLRRAALCAFGFVALLWTISTAEQVFGLSFRPLAIRPGEPAGLVGVLTAPLLHGSVAHLIANTLPLLLLGTLSGVLYPRASLRAVALVWIGSGLFVWAVGRPSYHLGASGLAHGLMFFVFVTGILRRDRAAIAGALIAFFLYGGMVLTVLPREAGTSWEAHLGGALAGLLAAILWRRLDPPLPRKRYSWEDEPAESGEAEQDRQTFEPPSPAEVPVLWRRDEPARGRGAAVLPFRRRQRDDGH